MATAQSDVMTTAQGELIESMAGWRRCIRADYREGLFAAAERGWDGAQAMTADKIRTILGVSDVEMDADYAAVKKLIQLRHSLASFGNEQEYRDRLIALEKKWKSFCAEKLPVHLRGDFSKGVNSKQGEKDNWLASHEQRCVSAKKDYIEWRERPGILRGQIAEIQKRNPRIAG